MITTCWLTGLSTACSVLNVELYHRDDSQPLPKWLNNYVINKLGNLVHDSQQIAEKQCRNDVETETEDLSDGTMALSEKEDVFFQLLSNIYIVLAESKVQEKEQLSAVSKSNHWKEISRTMDLVFVIVFMFVFLFMHVFLLVLISIWS